MDFLIHKDLESIAELLELTQEELAEMMGVSRITVNNWLSGKTAISKPHVRQLYELAYERGIRLNRIKEQFYLEDEIRTGERLLFHGAKTSLEGKPNLKHNKRINDFGNGFYCGENLEQSVMFVASYPESSLYMLKFREKGLKKHVFHVDRNWMLMVAYYRGRLDSYANSNVLKKQLRILQDVDYIIAPIADNRMFEIIDSFIDGEITDVQCQHCLSATNLGNQFVFVSQKALGQITMLEKCFLSAAEKEDYLAERQEHYRVNIDKVKLARKQYRNQGSYIEEILT